MVLQRKENVIVKKTDAFSDRIVKMSLFIKRNRDEDVMTKQILRSGTSIGANVAESINAQSPADFVSKLNIALKEADETYYWLKKLYTAEFITTKEFESMEKDNIEIIKLLTSIIKTKKSNMTPSE
ncbi:MAG: four helix bundle protein [Prevotella sp.]|nr:four helix bundle protein [Prevotella sp.]